MCVMVCPWYLYMKWTYNDRKKDQGIDGKVPQWYDHQKGGIPS